MFFCVGGGLLAFLFIADALLPRLPAARGERSQSAAIRIHSGRKWPERIVLDTSPGTIVPVQNAKSEVGSADAAIVDSPKAAARGASGPGLHIVYNIVAERPGGRLEPESWPGAGTIIQIILPRIAPSG
jgi:signal transduction histidine kinase